MPDILLVILPACYHRKLVRRRGFAQRRTRGLYRGGKQHHLRNCFPAGVITTETDFSTVKWQYAPIDPTLPSAGPRIQITDYMSMVSPYVLIEPFQGGAAAADNESPTVDLGQARRVVPVVIPEDERLTDRMKALMRTWLGYNTQLHTTRIAVPAEVRLELEPADKTNDLYHAFMLTQSDTGPKE